MPQSSDRAATERQRRYAGTHNWIGAATIPLLPGQAHTATLRASVTIKADTKVQILDAYCKGCKRTYEAAAHEECPARDQRASEHLRGGRPGERIRGGRPHPPMPVLPPNRPAPPARQPVAARAPTRQPTRPAAPAPLAAVRPIRPARRRHVVPEGQLAMFGEALAS